MEDDTSWHTSSSDDELGGERSTPFIIPSTTTTLTHSNGSSSSSIGGSGSGVGAPPPHLSTSSRSGQQHYELDDDDDDDDDHHDPHRDLDDGLGTIAVRGVPVWIADHERKACILCGTPFGFFVRRHHCRRCGEIVCAECSGHTAILLEMLPPIVVQCMRRAMALESGDHAARRPFDLASSLPSHVGEVLIAVGRSAWRLVHEPDALLRSMPSGARESTATRRCVLELHSCANATTRVCVCETD